MEERNVKIVHDHRKSFMSIKFDNSKTLSMTMFDKNAR